MAGIALKNGLFNSGELIAGKGNSTCDCAGNSGATGVLGGNSKGDPGEEDKGDSKGEEGEGGEEGMEDIHGEEGGKQEANIGLGGNIKSSEEAKELSSKKEAAEESTKEGVEVEAGRRGGNGRGKSKEKLLIVCNAYLKVSKPGAP
jgi:hypothetical protein